MGKHSARKTSTTTKIAAGSAAVAALAVAMPATASADTLSYGGQKVNVDGKLVEQARNAGLNPEAFGAKVTKNGEVSQQATIKAPAAPVQKKVEASKGQKIVDAAMSKIGSPYVWGAAGPNSFDCSGLTTWAYQQAGISIPRTSGAQASAGKPVSRANLQPGDIISYYGGNSHVAIYIGNNKVVHAINSGTPVKVTSMDYMPYTTAVRFF